MTDDVGVIETEMERWFLGDQFLWSKYLPRAWRSATGAHVGERFPSWINVGEEPRWSQKAHGIFASYAHLLHFRLGWTGLGDGLTTWNRLGRPVEDPTLEFLSRLGGNGLDWFITWAATFDQVPVPAQLADRFQNMVHGDALHTSLHTYAPGVLGAYFDSERSFEIPDDYRLGHGSLMTPTYSGWWNVLALADEQYFADGIDVTAHPIGWLGRYRRSPRTGLPHATSEEVHAWGHNAERRSALDTRLARLRQLHPDVTAMPRRGALPGVQAPIARPIRAQELFGVGMLERYPDGRPLAGVLSATYGEFLEPDGSIDRRVLIDCVAWDDEDESISSIDAQPDGSVIVHGALEYRVRRLAPADGVFLSRYKIEFPTDVLTTLIEATARYEEDLDHVYEPTFHPSIEWLDLQMSYTGEQAFALGYGQAIPSETTGTIYWLGPQGWVDDCPEEDARWQREVTLQLRGGVLGLDTADDDLEVLNNASSLTVHPLQAPFLTQRWMQGLDVDCFMAVLVSMHPLEDVCIGNLPRPARLACQEQLDCSPFVHAESDPASRAILQLDSNDWIRVERLLSLYCYLYDGNQAMA